MTQLLLDQFQNASWGPYSGLLRSITTQSIAAALRMTRGPALAAAFLSGQLGALRIDNAPLALLNSSGDALTAESLASESTRFSFDRRTSAAWAPMLLASHDLTSAFEAWMAGEHTEAHRQFWRVLRRQIALGSATLTRQTKAFYAQSVFDDLDNALERHQRPEHLAKNTHWSQAFVRAYVDESSITSVIAHANRIDASKQEGTSVAIEIFRGWMLVLPAERTSLAARMIGFVARSAAEYRSSFFGNENIGGQAIEALHDLAEQRPEFRAAGAHAVASAILSKLNGDEWWTGTAGALKTAVLFFDVLERQQVRGIAESTLSLVDNIDPTREVWVIVQPALDVLVSEQVQNLAKGDQALAHRIVLTILRFGLNQKTEHVRLLFYLYHFDLGSVREEPMASQLKEVVDDVRKQALTINSSNSVDSIRALLLASSFSREDGVTDALHAVILILRTAFNQSQPAMSFSVIY
jgi:hypothetical protein